MQASTPASRVLDPPAFASFTDPTSDGDDKRASIFSWYANVNVAVVKFEDVDGYSGAM